MPLHFKELKQCLLDVPLVSL